MNKKKLIKSVNNPLVENSIKIWRDINRYFSKNFTISYLTLVINNEDFTPGLKSGVFQSWFAAGIRMIGDLLVDGVVM